MTRRRQARPPRLDGLRDVPQPPGLFDGPAEHWPKISETLLRYAEPVLLEAPRTKEALDRLFMVHSLVWNAVVLADHAGDPGLLKQVERTLAAGGMVGPGAPPLFGMLVDRKRRLFAPDWRLISDVVVTVDKGDVHVRAAARRPSALRG